MSERGAFHMIRFINGGVNSDREEQILDLINVSVSKNREVIVIIPDQYSFEYDKKLYNRLGAIKFNKLTTVGFNRLADILEKKYGSLSSSGNADDNSKFILMYKAVRELRSKKQLGYYTTLADKSGVEKGNFITQLIEIVQQLRESGITCEMLNNVILKLNSTLSQKMNDISKIYSEYMNQLENAGLHDSISALSTAVKIARENEFFCGKDVFVDAFSSFTYDEMKMLELCIANAENVTFSFVIDNDSVKNTIHPFRLPEQTFGSLKNAAQNKGYTVVQTSEQGSQSKDIAYLGKNLLSIGKHSYDEECGNINILCADDIYSEASYVCACISHLVQNETTYSDIAVVVRNIDECASVFEGMMQRYDIPFFIDQQERISSSAIVQYFNSVFKCLTSREYKTENILRMIKSPFYSPKKYLVNEIEQYCLKWNIDGEMWTKKFFGLDESLIYSKEKQEINDGKQTPRYIDMIENARLGIISPIEKMRARCARGELPANEICEAFFELLADLNVSDRTYSVVRQATLNENETQLELSRELRQLWNSVLSAVKSIYDCLGSDPISLHQFYELYRVMLSQLSVSSPPQKIDCVRLVDASHSRLDNVKIAFICQANDGVFPKTFSNNGLLSHIDVSSIQNALNDLEKDLVRNFSGDARNAFMREDLACYNAVSLPSQKLFVTYVTADLSGEEKRPSVLIKEILNCFDDLKIKNISEISPDFFCTSYKSAYHTAIEHFRDKTSTIESIKMSLDQTSYYKKLTSLVNADKVLVSNKTKADKTVSASLFFKNNEMEISASQLDTFFKCPFGYFCSYGLKLRAPQKMELNGIQRGKLIHKVLENAFSIKDDENKLIILDTKRSDEFISNIVQQSFDEYMTEELKGDFGKTSIFMFDLKRLMAYAETIVKYVRDELLHSGFRPVAAEYKFGKDDQDTSIKFTLDSGKKLSITGYIDRLDILTENNKKYVRIIDYKSGKIEINYALLQCGLDLQMLIYLDSYMKSVKEKTDIKPAAVEYFSFGEKASYPLDKNTLSTEQERIIKDDLLEKYKPKGYVADLSEVVNAFEKTEHKDPYVYTPFKEKSGRIPYEELQALRQYACEKVIEFATSVENGQFPMKPVNNQCTYCDYKTVCCKEKYDDFIDTQRHGKELAQDLKDTLARIMEETDKEENS